MADRPLWEVMRRADSSAASDYTSPEARILRAIADEVVPEEPKPFTPELPLDQRWKSLLWYGYYQRQRIRQRLLDEADRAEAGEVEK
jgi:hypothetical protein